MPTDEHRHHGSPVFDASDTEGVRKALHELGEGLLSDLGVELDRALQGPDDAARAYVRAYRRLTACLLVEARKSHPDMIVETPEGLTIVDVKGHPAHVSVSALENASAEAPFTTWADRFELADAVALDLTNRLRQRIGSPSLVPPVDASALSPAVDGLSGQRFMRRVRHYLNHPDDENPLVRLMEVFGLSKTALGSLFGVKRQAIDGWLEHGVPVERQEKLVTVLAVADLLERKLKPGRVPGVARRPAAAYDGDTMLELIGADRHRELLQLVRDSFDWSIAA